MSFINFMENFISGFTGTMLLSNRFSFGSFWGGGNPFMSGNRWYGNSGYNFGPYKSSCFGGGFNFGNTMDQFSFTRPNYSINNSFNFTNSSFVSNNYYSPFNIDSFGGVNNNKIKLPGLQFSSGVSASSSSSTSTSASAVQTSSPTGKYDTAYWKSKYGYDGDDGQWLFDYVKRNAKKDPGQCSKYVRLALEQKYGLSLPKFSARTFESKIAPKLNGKYKKITIPAGAKFSDFPPGAIFLYFPDGASKSHWKSAASKELGHVSMNGYANGYLELMPDEVWVPVNA